jgi:hypothetical protein
MSILRDIFVDPESSGRTAARITAVLLGLVSFVALAAVIYAIW